MPATSPQIEVRRANERGTTEIGWLHSRHSFSFGHYYDPRNMGYRSLRVLNDDVVDPNSGFGEHGHDNMEIITWIIDGVLRHTDSTGTRGEIRPGEVQVMTAGRGIRHSEMNPSGTDSVHLLQIWIEPDTLNLPAAYSQKGFASEGRHGRWQTLVSPDGRDDSLRIHQDAILKTAELDRGNQVELALSENRHAYLHVAFGDVQVGDTMLASGDAATLSGPASLDIAARDKSQLLFFDLA